MNINSDDLCSWATKQKEKKKKKQKPTGGTSPKSTHMNTPKLEGIYVWRKQEETHLSEPIR